MLSLLPFLVVTTVYHAIASLREAKQPPPGQLINVDGRKLHLWHIRCHTPASLQTSAVVTRPTVNKRPTVILEHSLGGVEGYLLVQKIAAFADVCICDRAGYGWSEVSWTAMTSEERVRSLNYALTKAHIEPPYILVGDSLGSYHMRLFAHHFPEKVAGLVLTDGLHETALLNMPWSLRCLQALFFTGFIMSMAGSTLGIIRLAGVTGLFHLIKPELQSFSNAELRPVLRSFYRPKHWFTMAREIFQLDHCGEQLKVAHHLSDLPVVSIKAKHFFKPTWWSKLLPLAAVEQLRDEMHDELMELSTQCTQLKAESSSHFVWTDQPTMIIQAIRQLYWQI